MFLKELNLTVTF